LGGLKTKKKIEHSDIRKKRDHNMECFGGVLISFYHNNYIREKKIHINSLQGFE